MLRRTALKTAIDKLGFHTYHMYEAMKNPSRDLPLWTEAMTAKYRHQGKPYGREEFDKLFGATM